MKKRQDDFSRRFRGLIERIEELESFSGRKDLNDVEMVEFPDREVFTVTVCGFTKCGKSSFCNVLLQVMEALIGDISKSDLNDVTYYCPVENRSFTNLLWSLSYGEKNEYILERKDEHKGEGKMTEHFDLGEEMEETLYDLVHSFRESPMKYKRFLDEYKPKIEVKLNLESLKYFEICDLPGKFENNSMNEMIEEQVMKSDIIIYVFESNRGKFNQLDQHHIRDMIRMTSQVNTKKGMQGSLPLEHRMFFVGNKVDFCVPSRSAKHRNKSLMRENVQNLIESLKSTVLEKLNSPTLFDNAIEENQVFFTCSNEQVKVFRTFEAGILGVRDALIKRREDLFFNIPAEVNCTNLLNSIGKTVTLLENLENKIRCLGDIFRSTPLLEKRFELCRKEMNEKLKERLADLFHNNYEEIRDVVCEEEIDPETIRFSFDNDRVKCAKRYLKNKFDMFLKNETKKVYFAVLVEFEKKLFSELSAVSPLANDLFSSPFFDGVEGLRKSFSITDKEMYHPNSPTLRKVVFLSLGCHALALATPPILALTVALAPVYILSSLPAALSITTDLTMDATTDLSRRTEFDFEWRSGTFGELYDNFHSKSGEKKIVKVLGSDLEKTSKQYFENLRKTVLEKVRKLETKRENLRKLEVKSIANALYEIEVDCLNLRHDYTVLNKYKRTNSLRIGQGSFSRVYAVGESTACKVQRYATTRQKREICREISVLRRHSGHPGLVKFFSCSHDEKTKRITIYMERCSTNLSSVIFDQKIGLKERISIARQIASAMSFLNSKGFFHRDMKAENILFNNGKVYLCDFGSAKSIGMSLCTHESVGGSNYYLDPILQCRMMFRLKLNYGLKRDVYSMGIILAELWENERVWSNLLSSDYQDFVDAPCLMTEDRDLFVNLKMLNNLEKKYEDVDEEGWIKDRYQQLVDKCTLLVETERPSFKEIETFLASLYDRLEEGEEVEVEEEESEGEGEMVKNFEIIQL